MPSYIPEYVYSQTGWDERCQPVYGLVQWPEHLKPREQERNIQLTKKGESYVQAALAETGGIFFLTLDSRDRTSIATTIDRLIDMLDAMELDPDLEPALAGWAGTADDREQDVGDELEAGDADFEFSHGWEKGSMPYDQSHIAMYGTDEAEDVSEDEGACIQSQPHDEQDEGDREPLLGWSATCGQGPKIGINAAPADFDYDPQEYGGATAPHAALYFDGDGCVAARTVLRNLHTARPDVRQDYVGGWCGGSYEALRVEGLSIKSNKGRLRLDPDQLTVLRPGVAMIGGFR